MMKSLLKLSASYIFLFLPITIINYFEDKAFESSIILFLYFPTYVINFFFYIYKWEIFRTASYYLIKEIKEALSRDKPADNLSPSALNLTNTMTNSDFKRKKISWP